MSDETFGADPVGKLADEFLQRYRRGERPSPSEYAGQYPEHADRIRELFPMLVMMEQGATEMSAGANPPEDIFTDPAPTQIGEYNLLREIGRGGMGVVYEAEQLSLNRRVAVKVLSTQIANDQRLVSRFHQEAQAAARLHHTNIVPVYEVGREDDVCYYAMQLIHGQAISDVLRELKRLREQSASPTAPADERGSSGPGSPEQPAAPTKAIETPDVGSIAESLLTGRLSLSSAEEPAGTRDWSAGVQQVSIGSSSAGNEPNRLPVGKASTASMAADDTEPSSITLPGQPDASYDEAKISGYFRSVAEVGAQVADALEHVHREGILHRDIKPSNLLLDLHGRVWITDFGLAKTEGDDLTNTGDVVGTVQYMPPERFRGQSDQRSDIYSLGITLYEMLALRPAFDPADRMKAIQQALHESPPPLRKLDPRIPADLETVVLKAIDREPRHRYQTAGKLKADLQRFLQDKPIAARRVTRREQLWRWCRRNPVVAGLTAALLATLMVGLAAVSWQWLRAERNALVAQRKATEAELATEEAKQEAARANAAATRQREARLAAETSQRRFRRLLYMAHMNLLPQAWQEANVSRIHRLLETHVPPPHETDLRGFEWYYWWAKSHQYHASLRHEGPVFATAVSSDGPMVISAGAGQPQIKVWDTESGSVTEELTGPGGWIHATALSANGQWLAAGGSNGDVWLWDLENDERQDLPDAPDAPIHAIAFDPQSTTLAAGAQDGAVRFWSLADGTLQATWDDHPDAVATLSWSPDGKSLAMSFGEWTSDRQNKQIWLRSVEDRKVRHFPRGTGPLTLDLNFSPDGQRLATAGTNGVMLWNLATGRMNQLQQHTDVTTAVSFSPDGRLLASGGSDRQIQLWDTEENSQVATLKGHGSSIGSLAFTADGQRLISGSEDGTVKLWEDFLSNDLVLNHQAAVHSVAVSPDGSMVAAAGDSGTVQLWKLKTAEKLGALRGELKTITQILFSPDGSWLAACGHRASSPNGNAGRVEIWSLEREERLRTFGGPVGGFEAAVLSPDGRHIATAGAGGKVQIWNTADGTLQQTFDGHTGRVRAVAFSPDGMLLASAGNDLSIRLWNVNTGKRSGYLTGHTRTIFDLAFSPDGQTLASASQDQAVRLWNVSQRSHQGLLHGHAKRINAIAFSPDGRTLATGSGDQTIRLWDTVENGQKCRLEGHRLRVDSVAFSPDGRTLVSGDISGEIRLWPAATEPHQLEHRKNRVESR